jgi:hypothetical protein
MTIKPCYPDGKPIDPEDLKKPRHFTGTELYVFDSSEEFNLFMGYIIVEEDEFFEEEQ